MSIVKYHGLFQRVKVSKYAYLPIKQNINEGGDERVGAVGGIFQDVLDRMIYSLRASGGMI